jgi:hypothetical protein
MDSEGGREVITMVTMTATMRGYCDACRWLTTYNRPDVAGKLVARWTLRKWVDGNAFFEGFAIRVAQG